MFGKKSDGGQRKTLLVGASVLAAAAGAMAGAPAVAQDTEEEAIIVTGSRIPQPNLFTTSPVTQVTNEDVTTQGVTRIEDLINQLPQAFAAQNSTVSNGSDGTATVNLRGLGSARTLVLVDGRRMPYGSPNSPAADLNQIPSQLVERVEVLTGGASAVYGSDAIAGVVNFIMRDDFEGFEVDAQYGFFWHQNDFEGPAGPGQPRLRDVIAARAATNPANFALPPDEVVDGYSQAISAIFGASTEDGRGNVTAYATYNNTDPILQRDRDYSACSLGNTTGALNALVSPGRFTCGGSATSFPGLFTDFSNYYFTLDPNNPGEFTNYDGSTAYNFGPLNYFQRPDERYSLGAFARYEVNDHIEAYAQLMFTDSRTVAQIAPSGNFFSTASINCDNPLLSASQLDDIQCDQLADPDPVTPGNQAILGPGSVAPGFSGFGFYIGRRNVEGGGRQDSFANQSYRIVTGARGNLTEGWDYDIAGQFSRVTRGRVYLNDFSKTRLARSIDVIVGPALLSTGQANPLAGQPQCRSNWNGTDPNCVPYDIFTLGNVTPEALAYLQTPGVQNATMTQQVVVGTITGDLAGVRSPGAESNMQVALGLEVRRDEIGSRTDSAFSTDDLAGQGGATLGLSGATEAFDLFGEFRLPLVEGGAFAHLLSVDGAYRYSDYSNGIQTDTYKGAIEWAPTEDVRFRASYQQAVRAPNIIELFSQQGFGLFDLDEDPCGPAQTATLAACQSTPGAGAAPWYGAGALDSPAGQYNLLGGGNPDLSPETSETVTYGLVFTPRALPNLVVSIDYFDIRIEDTITTFGPENTLNACYFNSDAAACSRIFRGPTGSLWIGEGFVQDLNINIGGLSTVGIDINANYSIDVGNLGAVSFNLVGTMLDELITTPGPGIEAYDCVGFFGSVCGTPNPEWRHRFRVGWETPWSGIELAGTWRYYGEVDLFRGNEARIDYHFDEEHYLDLAVRWPILENTVIRAGMNNVLDNDPPISASVGTTGNGNTYPQTYDSMGRFVFVGATASF
ncbi:MAG: TonB-dependent receptor [Hyphomonadaceae bacterium]|nr:TonB-dependent receptor [Hyphomonadaceae bacterium]